MVRSSERWFYKTVEEGRRVWSAIRVKDGLCSVMGRGEMNEFVVVIKIRESERIWQSAYCKSNEAMGEMMVRLEDSNKYETKRVIIGGDFNKANDDIVNRRMVGVRKLKTLQ